MIFRDRVLGANLSPGEFYLTDGEDLLSLDAVVGLETTGVQDHAAVIPYGKDLMYIAKTGDVYRVTVVPEPLSVYSYPVGALGWGVHRRYRQRRFRA